ncbi:MAG TPA: TonB-dependent receptor, partial [Gemmatimonadaceae bacterium]|nr:TonB-dependent receptor [Gemmatimonadaceae bacterium]
MRLLPLALALLGTLTAAHAQTPQGARLTGTVTDAESNLRVPGAVIELEGVNRWTQTDTLGRFALTGVPPGPQTLRVRRVGYAESRVPFVAPTEGTLTLDVRLARVALKLERVTVTADPTGRARGELGTASVVDREAIANQTAASLQGILELTPGVPLSPPGLDGVQQISLRTIPVSIPGEGSGAGIGSFGTLIVLDGVPLSNNANLQSTGPRGELSPVSSAGGGVDLRLIPASTLERVEVIRGIPSARYGDLTQGAIIVDTRAGIVRPEMLGRYDARTVEVSAVGGRQLFGNQLGSGT